ncbi:MAG TPA: hypothetical protein VGK20_17565 [Candidatus Binatia bacterium]
MVRAILEGRKTQKRRVIQWPPWTNPAVDGPRLAEDAYALAGEGRRAGLRPPYGEPGDRLWVRERWCPTAPRGRETSFRLESALYEADGPMTPPDSRWHSPIHLPRHLSRIVLEVVDVRVETLHEISNQDAIAEGLRIPYGDLPGGLAVNEWFRPGGWARDGHDAPRLVFADLWDSLNASTGYGWVTNPWVWALTFRRVD